MNAEERSQDSEKSVRMVGVALLKSLCKEGHVKTCYSFLWAVPSTFPSALSVRDWLSAHKVGEEF